MPKTWWYIFVAAGLYALYFYCSLINLLLDVIGQDKRASKFEEENSDDEVINSYKRLLEKQFQEAMKWDKGTGCKIPSLDPFSNDTAWTYKKLKPIECKGRDWVKCYHSKCRVVEEIRNTVEEIKCEYMDIIYVDDFNYDLGEVTTAKDGEYELLASDHVSVSCTGTKAGKQLEWSGNTLGFRPVSVPSVPIEQPLNVLILGFDSTSRTGFIRLMPKSWKVINEELNATVMEGYNILGDGTPFALFPILTGKTELELPDVRKNKANKRTMDDFPFIFKKLKEQGYRTAFFEDMPLHGTFQFRFNGFKQQPADHYLQTFFIANTHLFKGWNYCFGDTPQFRIMLNLTEQFLELDGKRFIFTSISDITHDNINNIQLADDDTAAFLRRLLKRTEDTLIVVMGDHGPRYSEVRDKHSIRGKLDERLPLLAIRLPSRLTRARRDTQIALEANARVLTTAHDLHATILDALGMRRHWNPYEVVGADFKRGLTMLEPIPSNRSCSEAGVETHWCTCLVWGTVSALDPLYNKTAEALIDYINLIVKDAGSHCVPRTIAGISWVQRERPNSRLLSYSMAKDKDNYLGWFDEKTQIMSENYQIGLESNPGGAAYEATLTYYVKEDRFVVRNKDISRVNAYRGESDCILDSHPHLAPYCYCQR